MPYQIILGTETLMDMSHWENWITEQQNIFSHSVLHHTLFPSAVNTVIYCVWTPLYIASEHHYILRLNTVTYCFWTPLYIASQHCYILRVNTIIYCVWTLLYIASEHSYILHLNNVIYCVSKTEETNHFPHKFTFYDQEHMCWISNVYYYYTTRKLKIKQHK